MPTTNSTRIECPPTLPSVEQHANNTQFLPVHAIPENPDCFSTLKRRSDSQEVNSFCVRKEKRYCDCPQLDCKHRFYHKSMLEVRTVSSLRTIGSSLALLREYYQRSGNDPFIHPLFQLNTLLFDTIMDYAKCMSCVSVRWSSPALDGSKKLYTNNSQQNEGIIEFISKQNYKNEFINPYTLVCSISASHSTRVLSKSMTPNCLSTMNFRMVCDRFGGLWAVDMTSLFDANESEEVQLDSEVETTTEENLHLTQTMIAPSPSTVADPKVQYISGDEIIISYPHHAIYPTAYLIQNGGGNCICF